MSDLNKQIAEMMGMKFEIINGEAMIPHFSGKEKTMIPLPFHPTTNANDDHLVLKHIRENWGPGRIYEFTDKLYDLLYEKSHVILVAYEPGDYSLSALRVLSDE